MNRKAVTQFSIVPSKAFVAVVLTALVLATAPARGQSVTFSASAPGNDFGETNKATAVFKISTSGTTTDLVITLTNTAQYKPNDPSDILTAVAFWLPGDPSLTAVSALLANGSHVVEKDCNAFSVVSDPGGAVGQSWCYTPKLCCGPKSDNEGLGSSEFWGFGSNNRFPGNSVPGDCPTPGGVGGGITTSVDDGSHYNGGLKGRPFIQDSAVFVLSGLPANLGLSNIADVSFGYGTTPDQLIVAVPEPGAITLTAGGLLLTALIYRRRR
jgi:hypothetical protein